MTEIGWGSLSDSESYGRLGDDSEDYKNISLEDSQKEPYSKYQAASHGLIFARKSSKLWDLYDQRALVMVTVSLKINTGVFIIIFQTNQLSLIFWHCLFSKLFDFDYNILI